MKPLRQGRNGSVQKRVVYSDPPPRSFLGQGAFARVYRETNVETGQDFAVKVFKTTREIKQDVSEEELERNIRREIKIMKILRGVSWSILH